MCSVRCFKWMTVFGMLLRLRHRRRIHFVVSMVSYNNYSMIMLVVKITNWKKKGPRYRFIASVGKTITTLVISHHLVITVFFCIISVFRFEGLSLNIYWYDKFGWMGYDPFAYPSRRTKQSFRQNTWKSYPFLGSSTMLFGFFKPCHMMALRLEPSSLDTSMRCVVVSVQ